MRFHHQGQAQLKLLHVRSVVVRKVVVAALHPDVLDVPALIRVRRAARTQPAVKEGLYLLQLLALGFRKTAVDEEQAQRSEASIQEEGSCNEKPRTGMLSLGRARVGVSPSCISSPPPPFPKERQPG